MSGQRGTKRSRPEAMGYVDPLLAMMEPDAKRVPISTGPQEVVARPQAPVRRAPAAAASAAGGGSGAGAGAAAASAAARAARTPAAGSGATSSGRRKELEDKISSTTFFPKRETGLIAREKALMSEMTPDQLERYEAFRRSKFPLQSIKHLVSQLMPANQVTTQIQIALEGSSKMFVGDIIETARAKMDKNGETGPIPPEYIQEAYRQLVQEGRVPYILPNRRKLR